MSPKESRRLSAVKKSEAKKRVYIIATVAVVICVIGVAVFSIWFENSGRVFVSEGNRVVLYANGTFSAELPNNVRQTGTFTEIEEDGVTTVLFVSAGRLSNGSIVDDVLTIPVEWLDCCEVQNLQYILQ